MEYVNINREAANKLVDKAKASHFKIIILLSGFLGEDSVWRNTNGTAMNIHDIAVVTEWSEKTVRECIKFALDNGIIVKTNDSVIFHNIDNRPYYDEPVLLSCGSFILINRKEKKYIRYIR